MKMNNEEYEQRLASYKDSTIKLIMDINTMSREIILKKLEITTDSTLTEEQVVAKLIELKNSIDSGD